MLLDGRSELMTRRNASRIPCGGLVVFCSFTGYLFKTLGDTTGIYGQALTAFQPGMRDTREKLQRLPMHMTVVQEDCSRYAIVGLFYLRVYYYARPHV